jgi:hypothetical protein
MFNDHLKAKGWTEITELWEYAKSDWKIDFDTGHWMIVSNKHNPRVFSVHLPRDYESAWTVNLIEHLCKMEDERHRLRKALEGIRDNPKSAQEVHATAQAALEQCYHSWLVNTKLADGEPGKVYCPICGQAGMA